MQKKSERKGWGSGEVRERRKRMEETRKACSESSKSGSYKSSNFG